MKLLHFKGIHIVSYWFILIFTLNSAEAITLFPFVIYRNKFIKAHEGTRNHETIHIMQQIECGLVGLVISGFIYFMSGSWLVSLPALLLFYILYLLFFIINLFRFKGRAYDEIPFERESYLNSNRSVYLGLRKPFAWVKYIK
jgi:hypothetical protein